MRNVAVLVVLAAQVLYLLGMVVQREHRLATGSTVYVRTVPVDPRDIFRGDYVTLRYDVNVFSGDVLRGELAEHPPEVGDTVYAVLDRTSGGELLYRLDHLSATPPESGVFLKGRMVESRRFRTSGRFAASYGIEKYFVEQGRGREIESLLGRRDEMQIPMEVELAVGADGEAAIRGHRWSPIGVQLEMVRVDEVWRRGPGQAEPQEPRAPEVKVTLHNVGDTPRWLIDPGDHCSFQLAPSLWGATSIRPAATSCAEVEPSRDDLRRLDPGESYSVTLDLDTPRWYVLGEDGPTSVAAFTEPWRPAARLVYRPDPAWAEAVDLGGESLWLTETYTAAFAVGGRID